MNSSILDDPTHTVHSGVERFRNRRIDQQLTLLGKAPVTGLAEMLLAFTGPLRWSLASHVFRSAVAAARQGGRADLLPWLEIDPARLAGYRHGGQLVVPVELCRPVSVGADMPVFLLDPRRLLGDPTTADQLAPIGLGLDALRAVGYGPFLDAHLAAIVALRPRQLGEESSSWTTTALKSTIYTDFYEVGALVAKDIIHEATHNWLNDALDAEGLDLDGRERYYSPWKQSYRPSYAMLHSVMAFSRVVNALARMSEAATDPTVSAYAGGRLAAERERLRSVEAQLAALRAELAGSPIADIITTEYRAAVDGAP